MSLMELYQNKRHLLLQFKAITKKMKAYLEENRLEDFTAAVDKRQQVIEQVKSIDNEIQSILDREKAVESSKTQSVMKDIVIILEDLQGLNQKVSDMAGEGFKKMAGEMRSQSRVNNALRQYSWEPQQAYGFFLDRQK